MYIFRIKVYAWYLINKYKFNHWFFQWKQDDEGGIAFVVCNLLTFVKYKEHTIVNFRGREYRKAEKYQGQGDRIDPVDLALDHFESIIS